MHREDIKTTLRVGEEILQNLRNALHEVLPDYWLVSAVPYWYINENSGYLFVTIREDSCYYEFWIEEEDIVDVTSWLKDNINEIIK